MLLTNSLPARLPHSLDKSKALPRDLSDALARDLSLLAYSLDKAIGRSSTSASTRSDLRQIRLLLSALSHSIRHSPDFAASVRNSSIRFAVEENEDGEKFLITALNQTVHECMETLIPDFSELIMQISEGKFYIRPRLIAKNVYALTKRELSVLNALKSGATSREISSHLFISEATTKTHLGSIYRKLGVNNRTQAISLGLASGVITK